MVQLSLNQRRCYTAPSLHCSQLTMYLPWQGKRMDKGNTCQQPRRHQQGGEAQRAFSSLGQR